MVLPECARTSVFAEAHRTVYPWILELIRTQSVSASMVLSWKSPHRVRLALSQGGRDNRNRHLHSNRNHGQWSDSLPASCKTPENFRPLAIISPDAAWNLCSLAAFWLRNQQQQPSSVGASLELSRSPRQPARSLTFPRLLKLFWEGANITTSRLCIRLRLCVELWPENIASWSQ